VPAPATARLLEGIPVYGNGTMELVTPTGALLITGYAREFGPLPVMRIDRTGYGAGDRDPKEAPNVLRVMHGERVAKSVDESVVQIECEIDDMNPQLFGPLMDRLGEAGALDVFYAPVQMKKNRPGTLVTVIAAPDQRESITGVLFTHTTTIGVRYQEMRRDTLDRKVVSVETPSVRAIASATRCCRCRCIPDCATTRSIESRPRSTRLKGPTSACINHRRSRLHRLPSV